MWMWRKLPIACVLFVSRAEADAEVKAMVEAERTAKAVADSEAQPVPRQAEKLPQDSLDYITAYRCF